MAANLFGPRFLSYRIPAWHDTKGAMVFTEPMTATDAFNKMGAYNVTLEPTQTVSGISLSRRAVIRAATADDPQPRELGSVGPDYVLLPPADVCTTWDTAVNQPIETIGALGQGETFFISTKLPTNDVNGDPVDNYLLLISPMTGFDAIQGRVTPVRVVCQNTLVAAKRASTEVHRVVHDQHAVDRLAHWLNGAYTRALKRMEDMNAAFRSMAVTRVKDPERILELVYTMPELPKKDDAPDYILASRERAYVQHVERAKARRLGALELFNGRGTGMDAEACKGTAWGLYNAVVELEDHSTPRPATNSRGERALTGDRADRKARAYEYCLVEAQKADKAPKARAR